MYYSHIYSVFFQNEDGLTALMLACKREEFSNVAALLDQGVKYQQIQQHSYVLKLKRDRLSHFQASVSITDDSGKTALHHCAEHLQPDIAEVIMAADRRIIDRKDKEGFTPLHLSVISCNRKLLECLLSNGADANAVDKDGHNCIHWATGE